MRFCNSPSYCSTKKEMQLHCIPVHVVVLELRNFGTNVSANPELLVEFALQSLWCFFSRLNLSAGKLPLQRQRLIFRALAAEDFFPAHDQCSSYLLGQRDCLASVSRLTITRSSPGSSQPVWRSARPARGPPL